MKYTKIILGGLVALTTTAQAMPTQEQTKKVEPLVMDLMRDDQAALKSGKKTRVEVAESAMELAEKADSEAAKLLLMKGAFNLYVRAGEFDKAIDTLQSLQAAIPDMPPANMANIIEAALRVVPRKNGGQLYRLLDETKTRMRYTNEAASLEKSVKRNPADRSLRLKLAEHYAYLGKWDMALENFAATDGKVGAIAKSERGGEAATEKIADFWWAYPTGKADELVKCFRTHAAKLYEDAIAAGKITGLNKVQTERRIEEAKEFGENIFEGIGTGLEELVYKIGDGEKLEFVKCPAGTFVMGYEDLGDAPQEHAPDRLKKHKVTITKPFLFSKKLVTYGQLEALVKLTNGEAAKGTILSQWRFGEQNVLPIGEREKIVDVLGGKQMCVCQYDRKNVEIIAKALTKKFSSKIPKGYAFRLPTEAEWEYVAKAGKGDKGVFGKYLLGKDVERYIVDESAAWNEVVKRHPIFQTEDGIRLRNNFGYKVATKSPNEWGVFDLYDKRISEATLDMINRSGPKGWQWFWFNYEDVEVDPWRYEERSSEQGAFRANVVRGVADRRSNGGMISAGKWTAHKEDLIWRFRFVIAPDTSQLNKYPRDSNDLSATAKFKTDGNRNMKDSKKYCVIDISKGSKASKYPVTFMAEEPKGGWTDEYKGTKLVLRKIPAGTILIEGQKKEFEKEFYAGVFEVTQKQLELVTGKASWEKNHVMYGFNRPAVNVDFEMIRGKDKGASVDNDSFIGLLRKRTGLNIDLPTVSEWIYFGRAGSESPFNNGGSTEDDLKMLGRYKGNKNDGKGGYADGPSAVGMYIPNTWGIYDIHGGVSEWCLDNGIEAPIRNPKWGEDKVVEKQRVVMGGHWDSNFSKNQYSGWVWPLDAKKWYMGFRIVAK